MNPRRAARRGLLSLPLVAALVWGATAFVAPAQAQLGPPNRAALAAPAEGTFEDGTVLVGFRPGTPQRAVQAAAQVAGATADSVVGAGTHVLRVGPGRVAPALALLQRDPGVAYAEPNYLLHADQAPDDPLYAQLWSLKNTGQVVNGVAGTPGADISAEAAWAVTTGSANVVVGIVDTGIDYTHPDLAPNVWSNPGGIGGCPAGTHGFNGITGTCDPLDDNNHGSHVSGTIGAAGNNALGVAGINWNVRLMGLKFLDATGSGTTADAIRAIDFAVQAKQAGVPVRVLNNSWGGGPFSQALLDEINKAGANDILFVAAAGNSAANLDLTPAYPASYGTANELVVAATDQHDALASFSNFGRRGVHLGAPGTGILSTVRGGTYASFSGTSMATPHITGAAALVLSVSALTTDQLKATLLAGVDPDPALANVTVTGGRLNLCKAIPGCGAAAATATPTTLPATATPSAATATATATPTATLLPTATPSPTATSTAVPPAITPASQPSPTATVRRRRRPTP